MVEKRDQSMKSPGWRNSGNGQYAVSRCEVTDHKAGNGKMIKGDIGPDDKWCWLTKGETRVSRTVHDAGPPDVGDDLAASEWSCLTHSSTRFTPDRYEHGGCFHTD